MKPFPVLLAACLAAGCASGPVVQTDRDPTADFSHYRTFAWRQEPPVSNPLLRQRIVDAVAAELALQGMHPAAEAEADVLLVGNVAARDETSLEYFYESNEWAGWNWRYPWPGGTQRVELYTYQVGTLVLDMFDARTQRAVWRGVAQGTVPRSEASRSRDAMTAVHRMFDAFPAPTPASR